MLALFIRISSLLLFLPCSMLYCNKSSLVDFLVVIVGGVLEEIGLVVKFRASSKTQGANGHRIWVLLKGQVV